MKPLMDDFDRQLVATNFGSGVGSAYADLINRRAMSEHNLASSWSSSNSCNGKWKIVLELKIT
jgi:hypothetical protein